MTNFCVSRLFEANIICKYFNSNIYNIELRYRIINNVSLHTVFDIHIVWGNLYVQKIRFEDLIKLLDLHEQFE